MKTYVLLLNWNNWTDTVECVSSLLESDYRDFKIIIVDNASTDSSVERILESLSSMSGRDGKKIICECLAEDALINVMLPETSCAVTMIRNNANYGFGGGNNTGLEYILKNADFDYVWLLNNDTIVDKRALSALVTEAEKDKKVAFVGSVLRYYGEPDVIQAVGGGWFHPHLGLARLYMKNRRIDALETLKKDEVLKKINYLMGASILIRKSVLTEVGLFDKKFFVYAEELDLIYRARKKGWRISIAMDSHVFHKDSASTKDKKDLYYYFLYKSNIIFLKKNYGWTYVLTALLPSLVNIFRTTHRLANIAAALRGIFEGLRYATRRG